MKLTKEGEYAVRIILFLAAQEPGLLANRKLIADRMDIPYHFLGKIGPKLAASGLLDIMQGPKGGYRLRRPAGQITLLDVVEAVEGEIHLNDCVVKPGVCGRAGFCPVHKAWGEARETLRRSLSSANFEQMAACDASLGPGGRNEFQK
ncbi:MAG: Rrf2 family transcriptional regulator [Pseudomonadota bacterium]